MNTAYGGFVRQGKNVIMLVGEIHIFLYLCRNIAEELFCTHTISSLKEGIPETYTLYLKDSI